MLNQKSKNVPSLILRSIDAERIGIRFGNIRTRQQFDNILQRLLQSFPLSECKEIDKQLWWVVMLDQLEQVAIFAKKFGLRLILMK